MGDEDGLIYISSRKVQRKPESCSEDAGWQTRPWTDQAIRNCFFFLFPYLPILLGPKGAFITPLRHNSSSARANPYDGGTEKQYTDSTHNWHLA